MDAERVAVIVGIGQVNDRPADPAHGLDSIGLMRAALDEADQDAGGGWLGDLDSLGIVQQISFRQDNPVAPKLAALLGLREGIAYESVGPNGDSLILLLNEAANRIARGEATVAAVTGGEALRTASGRAALAAKTGVANQNPLRRLVAGRKPGYRQVYGLTTPVDVYPLYENAGRAAYGQTLAEGQRESGEIWSRFSKVAAQTPAAWIHAPRTPDEITTPTADNRPNSSRRCRICVGSVPRGWRAGVTFPSRNGRVPVASCRKPALRPQPPQPVSALRLPCAPAFP